MMSVHVAAPYLRVYCSSKDMASAQSASMWQICLDVNLNTRKGMIKAMGIIRFLGLTTLGIFIIGIIMVLIIIFAIAIRTLIQMFKDM